MVEWSGVGGGWGGWRRSSVEKNLPSKCEVLGSIPSMATEIRKGIEKQETQEKGREDGCSDECWV